MKSCVCLWSVWVKEERVTGEGGTDREIIESSSLFFFSYFLFLNA
ncbi:hypothetical protein DFA_10267 [Cavenderia fasciculata]|uniref:Uncharacterized protein n=1 Tax=Cavenderia fasciculata TaxID=261658 RepID=F4Q9R3_CACFS|nr:uncharacterized protein DFA_10267 [Cavenderia fasciculata]EGG15432.1 hypothetical protein DFA_10267 [Cavenderia fasciculata]|eukprot:XP_004354174.1 hypothetical protein DFA_10267 [Cavenderia fasciculata]